MAIDQTEALTCAVCGEPLDDILAAECNWCDARFHLNQRNDIEAKDCGKVWIDEQHLALQFACDSCLAKDGAPRDRPKDPSVPARRRYRKRA